MYIYRYIYVDFDMIICIQIHKYIAIHKIQSREDPYANVCILHKCPYCSRFFGHVCVCVCVCVCMCLCLCLCVCLRVCQTICLRRCCRRCLWLSCVCLRRCCRVCLWLSCVYACVCFHVHIHIRVCVRVCVCVCAYVQVYPYWEGVYSRIRARVVSNLNFGPVRRCVCEWESACRGVREGRGRGGGWQNGGWERVHVHERERARTCSTQTHNHTRTLKRAYAHTHQTQLQENMSVPNLGLHSSHNSSRYKVPYAYLLYVNKIIYIHHHIHIYTFVTM